MYLKDGIAAAGDIAHTKNNGCFIRYRYILQKQRFRIV